MSGLWDGKKYGHDGTLAGLFRSKAYGLADCAHLAFDVQRAFSESAVASAAAGRLAREVAPAFSRMGVPTYWIRFINKEEDLAVEALGFHPDVAPAAIDRHILKNKASVFQGSDADAVLKRDGRKMFFASGFYRVGCLYSGVLDGLNLGYGVALLDDCTDNLFSPECQDAHLRDLGVPIVKAAAALEFMRERFHPRGSALRP